MRPYLLIGPIVAAFCLATGPLSAVTSLMSEIAGAPGLDTAYDLQRVDGELWAGATSLGTGKGKKRSARHWVGRWNADKKTWDRLDLSLPEEVQVVAIRRRGTAWHALLVGKGPEYETTVYRFSGKGKRVGAFTLKKTFDKRPASFHVSDSGIFVLGTRQNKDKSRDGWLAKLGVDGNPLWEKTFDKGKDETLLYGIPEGDGLVVLADSGKYNRFGQGPSRLWVFRVNGKGEQTAEVLMDKARANTRGDSLLVADEAGYTLSYTETELPPFRKGMKPEALRFDARLARLNRELKVVARKKIGFTDGPGTPLLAAEKGGVVVAGVRKEGTWLARVNRELEVVEEGILPVMGRLSVEGLVAEPGTVWVLGQVLRFPSPSEVKQKGAPPVAQDLVLQRAKWDNPASRRVSGTVDAPSKKPGKKSEEESP